MRLLAAGMIKVSVLVALCGCRPPAQVEALSQLAASEIPAAGRPIRIALGDKASSSDQTAYRLFAHIPAGADSSDVQFCMGQMQQCQAESATKLEAIAATLTSGLDVFVSKSFVRLSANLPVTVIARTASSQVVYQTAVIQALGSTPYGLPGAGYTQSQPGLPGTYGSYGQPGYPTQPYGQGQLSYSSPYTYGGQQGYSAGPSQYGYPQGQPLGAGAGPCIEADPEICQIELAIVEYTNQYRSQSGLPPVQYHPKLAWASRRWAMAQQIGHAGFPSQRQADYRQKFGNLDVSMRSENVAMNYGNAASLGQKFATQWYNSPGHKTNMLASGVTQLGAGVHRSGNGSYYAVQIFGN